MLNKEKQSKSIGLGIAVGTALGAIMGQVNFSNLGERSRTITQIILSAKSV